MTSAANMIDNLLGRSLKGKARRIRTAAVLGMFVLALTASCGRKHRHSTSAPSTPRRIQAAASHPQSSPLPAVTPGYTEEGIASWYGIPYNGRAAANGEIYDMETLVAAHRVLPFNTWLRVTNVANNKSVRVRVIDRGPFVEGRILDLSKAAARSLDLLGPGIGRIRLEVVASPPDRPSNDFYSVQVAAFSMLENAQREQLQYARRFGTAYLALKQGRTPLWRVLVGKEESVAAAQQLAKVLAVQNKDVFVVRLDEAVINSNQSSAPAASPLRAVPPVATNSAPQ